MDKQIKIEGYVGKWNLLDSKWVYGHKYYLWESDRYGDEVPCIITNSDKKVILEDVMNGFDDLLYYLQFGN